MGFMVGDYFIRFGGGDQFSPTFPRGGLAAVFAIEVLAIMASTSLNCTVQHKNIEDTSWTTLVTFSAMGSTGVTTASATGIKEQLRFVFSVSGTNATDAVYANVLAPMWRPY